MISYPPSANEPLQDPSRWAAALLRARQTILPKRLVEPGPNADQLLSILGAAASAPDHGQLLPWRFARVSAEQRAPLLSLSIVDGACGDPNIDLHERILSAGRTVQNMLLMATALVFGSALTSGKALKAQALRSLFELSPGEHALCFISVGTVQSRKPARPRPAVSDYVRTLPST